MKFGCFCDVRKKSLIFLVVFCTFVKCDGKSFSSKGERIEEKSWRKSWSISRIIKRRQCHRHERIRRVLSIIESFNRPLRSHRLRRRRVNASLKSLRRDAEEDAGCSGVRNTLKRAWFSCKKLNSRGSLKPVPYRNTMRSTRNHSPGEFKIPLLKSNRVFQ